MSTKNFRVDLDLTFTEWKRFVNKEITRLCGLTADDLPDVDYYQYYVDLAPPKEAAQYALEYACEEMGMDYDEIFGGD